MGECGCARRLVVVDLDVGAEPAKACLCSLNIVEYKLDLALT